MSVTPNRGLPLMESSQSEPEVVYNAAMEILDVAETLEVEASGDSPGVRNVTKMKFVGATVTEESGGVAVVTVDATSGAGGGSLEITDGTHDLTGVTKITVFGAVVGGTSGAATLTVDPTSGGGGGGNGYLMPERHPLSPDPADDEFEEVLGTAIDTAGTRRAGATAWTWGNQGTSTALQTGDGNLNLLGQADGNYHGIYQAAPGGSWKYRTRMSLQNEASSAGDLASVFVRNSANGHMVGFGPFANTPSCLLIKWNSFTSFASTGFNSLPRLFTAQMIVQPTWYEVKSDGTTLSFSISASGAEGSFILVATETIATFLGAADGIGIAISTNSTPPSALITDLFRRYA